MRLPWRRSSHASNAVGELRRFDGHTDSVSAVQLSADGAIAVSGSLDGTVRLWDVVTGRSIQILKGTGDAIKAVAFARDPRSVLTFSDDKIVHRWDSEHAVEIDQRPVVGPYRPSRPGTLGRSYILSAAFAPDGRSILLGSQD